ncbi:hypothetical protein L3Q82_010908 [Scortum barcoo]|uniref:Uncharacterized protein n=1 Tax=Scortum barcoo TaxID=214431 RepID=A0ACB8W8L3_9TELE|nr:hypothetical protein L3Q82_010908 [Scortum barcoo]
MIRKGKDCYRRKMEHQLQQNNICGVWKGLKTISGFKEPKSQPAFFSAATPILLCPAALSTAPPVPPHPLSRPSVHTYHSPPLTTLRSHLPDTATSHSVLCTSPPSTPPCSSLLLTTHQVRNALKKNRARKAAGPDGISSRLLKSCADQLCGIFRYTFNLSLKLWRVPQLWKTSCIVPVPKTPHPKELNSYRPVALTSHLMKTLERLVLAHLRPLVSSFMDPLQFAYQPLTSGWMMPSSTSFTPPSLTWRRPGSTVRIMFFDFSSAFNTIQPRLLGDKLQLAGVDHHLTTWILDYLTHRPQFVRVQGFESDRLLCSTWCSAGNGSGSFPVHPLHCRLSHGGDDREYRGLIQDFDADWCLHGTTSRINAGKTNWSWWWISAGVATLRLHLVSIQGMDIDTVKSYKTFYDSVVASAIFYGIVCWASSITDRGIGGGWTDWSKVKFDNNFVAFYVAHCPYICDVSATDSYGSYTDYFQDGYIRMDEDTNRDAGGSFVFIWYRQTTDSKRALTDLQISTNDREYQSLQQQHYHSVSVNLNEGTRGNKVYLWYKKQRCNPIKAVTLLVNMAAVEEYEKAGVSVIKRNLNTDTDGIPEYVCVYQ